MHSYGVDAPKAAASQKLRVSDMALRERTPRTLLHGNTCDGVTFHVYLSADGIHSVTYNYDGMLLSHKHESEGLTVRECVPDKRLFVEVSDPEFRAILRHNDIHVPFAVLPASNSFHGLCLDTLIQARLVA